MSRVDKLLFLDGETTGLDPLQHELVSVALILTSLDGRAVYDRWEVHLFAEHLETADPAALRVNGYSEDAWRALGAVSQREGATLLAPRLRGAQLIGHHLPHFDAPFLRATLERHGQTADWLRHTLDVASLAWPLFLSNEAMPGLNLRHVAVACGLPPEAAVHKAMGGAELARQCYVRLLEMRP